MGIRSVAESVGRRARVHTCPRSRPRAHQAVLGFPAGGLYGETRPILIDGHERGAEVYVLPSPLPTNGDRLLRDAIVYLTCLHESGHALGLAHTAVFAD